MARRPVGQRASDAFALGAARVRGGGGQTIAIRITVDAEDHKEALRRARREVGRQTKGSLQRVGDRVVLPVARRRVREHVPEKAAAAIVVRATTREARLTTKGPLLLGRIVGLQEFGGVVSVRLVAKGATRTASGRRRRGAKAMRTPWGPRAVVAGPRRYKARMGMTKAVQQTLRRYEREVAREVEDVLTREIR